MTLSHPTGSLSRTPWAFILFASTLCVTLALLTVMPGDPMLAGTVFLLGLATAIGWAIYRYPRKKKEPSYKDIAAMDGISLTPNLINLRLYTEYITTDETVQHSDTFHKELWITHGDALLGREKETSLWGHLYGKSCSASQPLPVSDGVVQQQRNIIVTGNAPEITIMDINSYRVPENNASMTLSATTVLTAHIATNKTAYFAPKGIPTSRSRKLSTGLIGERTIDRKYNLRSDDVEWARLLFTPDVLQTLTKNPTLTVTIKDHTLTITKYDSWLPASLYHQVINMTTQITQNMLTADICLKENQHKDPS